MFQVVFTQAARAELIHAQDWYEGEASGLGSHFRAEVDAGINRMIAKPLQFPVVYKKTVRRLVLPRFPYMLFFTIEGATLLVIACFHGSRDPRQWQQRT
ncbi:MAG: type II toxin-antitoxin system RelE/ParE family toxin [Bryobacteraceae bacterium]